MTAGDDIDRLVSAWSADHLTEEAVRSRTRRHWITRQQAEESDLASLLGDLAAAGGDTTVIVATRSGATYRGAVLALGDDCLTLRGSLGPVLIRVRAVSLIEPGRRIVLSGRRTQAHGGFLRALVDLEAEGCPVHLRLADGRDVRGEIALLADDFVCVDRWNDPRGPVYVPLDAVDEALFISG